MNYYSKYLKYKKKYLDLVAGANQNNDNTQILKEYLIDCSKNKFNFNYGRIKMKIDYLCLFRHTTQNNYWNRIINDNQSDINNNQSDINNNQSDIELSSNNNHIIRYSQFINQDSKIKQFDFNTIIDTINNKYLFCIGNNSNGGDIQLGITETKKETDENIYDTAARGIYEETGLYISSDYIQKNSQNFILLHKKDNEIKYQLAIDLIIIDGDGFFNGTNQSNSIYNHSNSIDLKTKNIKIPENENDFIMEQIKETDFRNKITKTMILLYGSNHNHIIQKMSSINPQTVYDSLFEKATKYEYASNYPVLIKTENLKDLFLHRADYNEMINLIP